MPHDPFPLTLEWLPGTYAVCRLESCAALPEWVAARLSARRAKPAMLDAPLFSITRTDAETSIVIDQSLVPDDVKAERGFRALRIQGVLDFVLTGILSRLTGELAQAGVPVFVISTHDTDILLVKAANAAAASTALRTVANISDSNVNQS